MTKIEINNLTSVAFNEKKIEEKIGDILREEKKQLFKIFFELKEKKEKNISLSVVIVGPKKIKKLNKIYRNKNKVTDVLSFSAIQNKNNINFINPTNALGEIIICPKYIKKKIKRMDNEKNKIGFDKRFIKVLAHGVYHLLGYSHKEMKELY